MSAFIHKPPQPTDYADIVPCPYEPIPQEYINQKWPENAQVAPNSPTAMDDILASIYRANENIAVCCNALEALSERMFGARPEETEPANLVHAVPDNALGRIHVALSNQHAILARLDVVKNRLVDLA